MRWLCDGRAGALGEEVVLHLVEQVDAGVGAVGVDAGGQVEVLHLQGVLVVAALLAGDGDEALLALADDQRGVLRAEEAGAVGRGAEEADTARC